MADYDWEALSAGALPVDLTERLDSTTAAYTAARSQVMEDRLKAAAYAAGRGGYGSGVPGE